MPTMADLKEIVGSLYGAKPERTLYHYTSLSAIHGIIKDNGLWATDIHYFTDSHELKHAVDVLSHEVRIRLEQYSPERKLLAQLQDWLHWRLAKGHLLFVTSFTEKGNLLSQWRGYCSYEKGLSLGFEPTHVSACASREGFRLGRCIYDSKTQMELAEAAVDAIESFALSRGEASAQNAHPSQSYHSVFAEIEPDLLCIAALMKHPSFEEETEWRAVSPVVSDYVRTMISYRVGKAMLIPYVVLPLHNSSTVKLALEHVYLGPTPQNNLSMNSLSQFLSASGVSPKKGITACQIPLYET
jgi:hypothetical protein